jgi:hypothetical protein
LNLASCCSKRSKYNLLSDQGTGLNVITVPGTLRDSVVLLSVVLEQQTELRPTHIMTDTGAYSDVVFGLFRLLGYRFSPRLADIGGTRFWRVDPKADYGELNSLARQRVSLDRIAPYWDDVLRLAGSLKLGRVSAMGIMRTLQIDDRPTRLAQAVAEIGRIDKTIHTLNFIDDETRRRSALQQLNLGEGRHSLARDVFHGKRGELYQRYREGQENQLSALGLVVNMIVLWNTHYWTRFSISFAPKDIRCSLRMGQGCRRLATSTSICSDDTRLPCPKPSPAERCVPFGTLLRHDKCSVLKFLKSVHCSIAPQTPSRSCSASANVAILT